MAKQRQIKIEQRSALAAMQQLETRSDEELEREMRRENAIAPVIHVGRGGAGNMISGSDKYNLERKYSSTSSSSNESLADRAKEKARNSLERTWSRITGHQ